MFSVKYGTEQCQQENRIFIRIDKKLNKNLSDPQHSRAEYRYITGEITSQKQWIWLGSVADRRDFFWIKIMTEIQHARLSIMVFMKQ
jgi:hypothetical protein